MKKQKFQEYKTLSQLANETRMHKNDVDFHLKSVAGRVLTLVDGVFAEGRQKECVKSLIKKEFREQFKRIHVYFEEPGQGSCGLGPSDNELFGDEHVKSL